jgi:uncharacterized phage protein (TIGR01671 family)
MKTLKLRIWDSSDKEWSSVNPSFGYSHNKGYFELEGSKYQRDNCIIQQYTGLKDKNGKEIYEGDRVRFGYTKYEDFFGEVIWLEDRASFGVKTKNAFETFEDLMDYMKYFEVVGNIFQLPCNPDHNGECLVCDCWLSDCPFNKENNDQDI